MEIFPKGMEPAKVTETEYEKMGRTWLGLGNLKAPVWFVGLEPGGKSEADMTWAHTWAAKFGGTATVDLHQSATTNELPYIGPGNRLHPTWSPLVRFRLAYAGELADDASVLRYQRERFGKSDGGEALLEVSAYSARSLSEPSLRRKYLKYRLAHLSREIGRCRPEVVVFYGRTYVGYYEKIVAGTFDGDGFRWFEGTLCAATLHPYQRRGKSPPAEFWMRLGVEMRRRIHERAATKGLGSS